MEKIYLWNIVITNHKKIKDCGVSFKSREDANECLATGYLQEHYRKLFPHCSMEFDIEKKEYRVFSNMEEFDKIVGR